MSAVINIEAPKGTYDSDYMVLSKGAPEVIRKFLKTVPSGYDECYLKYVKNGSRVLALAYKCLPSKAPSESYVHIKREEAESDLVYCGFIISECPLKPDTKRVINEFKASNHEVKMITGDNQLTAAYIGKELKFGSTDKAAFAKSYSQGRITWIDIDDKEVTKTANAKEVQALTKQYMLCMNGDILDEISTMPEIAKVIECVQIFSRTSPN
jgi:cation-transporting ATPase 13A1